MYNSNKNPFKSDTLRHFNFTKDGIVIGKKKLTKNTFVDVCREYENIMNDIY